MRSETSRAAGCLRSRTMLRLPRFACRKIWPIPGFRIGPTWRMLSPSGDSTLMTSAPSPARICVANGPITTLVRSRIRTPASGPISVLPSLRLDAGLLDELGPVGELVGDVFRELLRRFRGPDLEADVRELVLHLLLGEDGLRLGVDPIDDRLRQARRTEDPVPGGEVGTGQCLCDRRHVGEDLRAARRRHR